METNQCTCSLEKDKESDRHDLDCPMFLDFTNDTLESYGE